MAEDSAISWTDHTFNPWWGCTKVGPGCDHCYAESFDRRVGGAHWGSGSPRRLVKDWSAPRKWQRGAEQTGVRPRVFCASMADVFDNEVDPEWRARLWALVRETPLLRWIFLTKRIGNAAKMLPPDWPDAFGHCGLMSTTVNQVEADRDVPKLLATPAAWRGLSMEPLLGPVDLTCLHHDGVVNVDALNGRHGVIVPYRGENARLDWIIVGGESGPGARPMHPAWARSLRDQCAAAGVPFHFKQWGEMRPYDGDRADCAWFDPDGHFYGGPTSRPARPDERRVAMVRVGKKAAGRLLDGVEHNGMPGAAP